MKQYILTIFTKLQTFAVGPFKTQKEAQTYAESLPSECRAYFNVLKTPEEMKGKIK